MASLRKFKRIRVTKDTISAFDGFELVSYSNLEVIVRMKEDHSNIVVYWLVDDAVYDELVSFFLEILPKARPNPMW